MTDAPHILLVNPWIHDFAAYDFCANNTVFPCRREPFSWQWTNELKQRIAAE